MKTQLKRPGVSLPAAIIAVCILAGAGYGAYYYFTRPEGDAHGELILHTVDRDRFDHVVLEQGEIESSSNIEVVCEVENMGGAGTAILWVIDEGTSVEKGDLLVQLDQSKLENDLKQQRITTNSAAAKVIGSEALFEQAKIARTEYLEGTYKTEEKAILSEIAIAEQELRKAQLAEASTRRLVAKGLVKSLQLEADTYAVANARNQLEAAQGRLRVLQELTREKMLVQFDSDIEMARAQLESDRSILEEEQAKLKELEDQIAACTIHAPAAGVVVYANQYSGRGGAEFVVEPGATVRERQAIVRLPDPSKMQVKATINEGRITLVEEGMPVKIRVDAIEGMELDGRVTKVNRYAEPSSWFSSSIKEYATFIEILNPPPTIRTGMTAEARIFVRSLPNALQIPIQGVYEHGGKPYVLVREGRDFVTREIEVLATNESTAAIKGGLEEGEVVVLNLRNHLDLMDLPEVEVSAPEIEEASEATEEAQVAEGGERPRAAGFAGAPGGPGPGGPGGGGPGGGPGGPGAGRGGPGGGGFSPDQIVNRVFSSADADGDGILSAEEISGGDDRLQRNAPQADSDGDGSLTRDEYTSYLRQRMAERNAAGGGGPPGGGGGFGRP